MMNRTELMDWVMIDVNGGNYGDTNNDNGNTPMYVPGQQVEVFNTPLHATTYRRTIYEARKRMSALPGMDSMWAYRITRPEIKGIREKWIFADDIERK